MCVWGGIIRALGGTVLPPLEKYSKGMKGNSHSIKQLQKPPNTENSAELDEIHICGKIYIAEQGNGAAFLKTS